MFGGHKIEFSIPKPNTEPGLNQTGILSLCELKPTAQRKSDLGESLWEWLLSCVSDLLPSQPLYWGAFTEHLD